MLSGTFHSNYGAFTGIISIYKHNLIGVIISTQDQVPSILIIVPPNIKTSTGWGTDPRTEHKLVAQNQITIFPNIKLTYHWSMSCLDGLQHHQCQPILRESSSTTTHPLGGFGTFRPLFECNVQWRAREDDTKAYPRYREFHRHTINDLRIILQDSNRARWVPIFYFILWCHFYFF